MNPIRIGISKGCDNVGQNGKKGFQWSDDETEVLLSCTHLYKVQELTLSDDWELKSKVS